MSAQEKYSDNEKEISELVPATVSASSLLTDDEASERNKLMLRREARRKKILANAKDRLAKLNGRDKALPNGSNVYEEVSDPEVEPDIPNLRADIPQAQEDPDFRDDAPLGNTLSNMDFNALLGGANGETQANTNRTVKQASFLQRTRLHVLLTAIVTFVLTINDAGVWSTGFSVFTIIGVCLISELLLFTRHKEVDPLVNLLILLCGVQPQLANRVMNLLLILYNLFTDMGIFVFCFCALSTVYDLTHIGTAKFLVIK